MKKILVFSFILFSILISVFIRSKDCFALQNDNSNIQTFESHYTYENGKEYCETIEANLNNENIDVKQTLLNNGQTEVKNYNKIISTKKDIDEYIESFKAKINDTNKVFSKIKLFDDNNFMLNEDYFDNIFLNIFNNNTNTNENSKENKKQYKIINDDNNKVNENAKNSKNDQQRKVAL